MIKAVIFDVDNTLYSYTKAHKAAFDALAAYADRELGMSRPLFEELHQRTEHELRTYMGEVAALHNRCIRYQIMLENQGLPLYPHVLNMNGIYWDALLAAAVPSAGVTDAIRILKEKGIRIPEDVSIVGFDDIPFGAVSAPELTTIHVYKQELGKVAVRRVLDHIQYPGRHERMKIQICTKFIERGSVKDLRGQEGG